ncbi:MAG: outer membrane lipoprotein chaperone LolA [Candidatus Tectomicrobia bacterium]|uniref:Outer-membrane lipoprotein carrier protein n=1 Tax=Tectimicrobiota bacterium TaxID=2528274 RepID=A0A932GNC7_UNCTE|nr:outer membrane lipoprotein chaperone LolA [Candidatus Tectomicrobia bacterium]
MRRGWFNKFSFGLVLVSGAVLLPGAVGRASGPLSLAEIVERVQKVYELTEDISADFAQVSTLKSLAVTGPAGGQHEQQAAGKVRIKKPGMIRWDYSKPEAQVLLSDGKVLWRYASSEKVAYKDSLAATGKTPLSFLTGTGKIEEDFKTRLVSNKENVDPRTYLVELVPKEPLPTVEKLFLDVDRDSFWIKRVTFWDHFGNKTALGFSNIRLNVGLSPSLFRFTPAPGVRVESLQGISIWR